MTDTVPCPACSAPTHPGDRFCPTCGQLLAPSADDVSPAIVGDMAIDGLGSGSGAVAGDRPIPTDASPHLHSPRAEGAASPVGGGAATLEDAVVAETPAPLGPTSASLAASGATTATAHLGAGWPSADDAGNAARRGTPGSGASNDPSISGGTSSFDPAWITPPQHHDPAPLRPASVAQIDPSSAPVRRGDGAGGEDAGWFATTSVRGMLGLGLLLVAVGVLLVLVGKIDRTGTIGIIGLLIAVAGVFLFPVALVRAVLNRLT